MQISLELKLSSPSLIEIEVGVHWLPFMQEYLVLSFTKETAKGKHGMHF
jgi:hypothetical protein